MGLETGEFIDDLVQTNPVTATDPVTEGAAHIRLLKKTIQQTFPGFDQAVTATPTDLNNAAVKTKDETVSGIWTYATRVRLANNIPLIGRNFGDTVSLDLARVSSGDIVQFGDDTSAMEVKGNGSISWLLGALKQMVLELGTGTGLRVEKKTGGLSRVPTVGDVNDFEAVQNYAGNGVYANAAAVQSREVGGTLRTLLTLDTDDLIKVGNQNTGMRIRGLGSIPAEVDGLEVGGFAPRDFGGVVVRSRTGSQYKAAFRNPTNTIINADYTVSQDDENSILQIGSAGFTLTVDTLETGTSYMIFGNNGPITLARGAGITTFRYLGGLDGVSTFVTADVVAGAVLQIFHNNANTVTVYGGGLTPN